MNRLNMLEDESETILLVRDILLQCENRLSREGYVSAPLGDLIRKSEEILTSMHILVPEGSTGDWARKNGICLTTSERPN